MNKRSYTGNSIPMLRRHPNRCGTQISMNLGWNCSVCLFRKGTRRRSHVPSFLDLFPGACGAVSRSQAPAAPILPFSSRYAYFCPAMLNSEETPPTPGVGMGRSLYKKLSFKNRNQAYRRPMPEMTSIITNFRIDKFINLDVNTSH